jgi:SAM-dependent methyltransferase
LNEAEAGNSLVAYYAARAAEYERVYDKPERQSDLGLLRGIVAEYFRGCGVLEVACGTAYWTAHIAATARSVTATDISSEVLEVARAKPWPQPATVTFGVADAFDLAAVTGQFDAAFVGFWWSHVPRARLGEFLEGLHDRLLPDARVMVLDNGYVEGSSTPISRRDATGDTYQRRTLSTGDSTEVLKNFPSADEVRDRLLRHHGTAVEVVSLEYFWYATCRFAAV